MCVYIDASISTSSVIPQAGCHLPLKGKAQTQFLLGFPLRGSSRRSG